MPVETGEIIQVISAVVSNGKEAVTIDPNQCVIGRDDLAAECIGVAGGGDLMATVRRAPGGRPVTTGRGVRASRQILVRVSAEEWETLRVVRFPEALAQDLLERLRRDEVAPLYQDDDIFPASIMREAGTPAVLFMASMFFTSIYFVFRDSFEDKAESVDPPA